MTLSPMMAMCTKVDCTFSHPGGRRIDTEGGGRTGGFAKGGGYGYSGVGGGGYGGGYSGASFTPSPGYGPPYHAPSYPFPAASSHNPYGPPLPDSHDMGGGAGYDDGYGGGGYEDSGAGSYSGSFASDDIPDAFFYEPHKDCSCCKGFIYACGNEMCRELGVCTCSYGEEIDEGEEIDNDFESSVAEPPSVRGDPNAGHKDEWVPARMNCVCCKGYVNNCGRIDSRCGSSCCCIKGFTAEGAAPASASSVDVVTSGLAKVSLAPPSYSSPAAGPGRKGPPSHSGPEMCRFGYGCNRHDCRRQHPAGRAIDAK